MVSPNQPDSKDHADKPKPLLLFGFLYGQITGAVLTLVVVLYYLAQPAGVEFCRDWGFDALVCRGVAASIVVLAFVVSGVVGIWGLFKRHRRGHGL